MAVDTSDRRDGRAFAEQVLERVAREERRQRRQERLRYLLPVSLIVLVLGAWSFAFLDGTLVLRFIVQALAWISVVANVEQHLSAVLLGPFAPLPTIVSLLLLLAALAWVRVHQPDPPETLP